MFCSKCGTEIVEGAGFCQKCGTKVVYADASQQSMDLPVMDVKDQQTSEAVENAQQPCSDNTARVKGNLRKAATIGRVLMWGSLLLLFLSSFGALRINPAILAAGVAIGIILSVLGAKRPLGLSKIIELAVAVVLLVVIAVSVMSSGGGSDKYVQMVKSGTLDAYPQMTVGKAFDDFLDNPKWESGLSDGVRFVNVKGGILYYGEEAEILIQFIVDEKSGLFQYNACEINGIPQNDLVTWELLETIYNGSSTSAELDSQGGSDFTLGETTIGETETSTSSNSGTDDIDYTITTGNPYSNTELYLNAEGQINDIVSSYAIDYGAAQYAIYDLDKDGIEELIVAYGEIVADQQISVYVLDPYAQEWWDSWIYLGSFVGDCSLFEAEDGNGIYAVRGFQGIEWIYQITKEGDVIYEELISERELSEPELENNMYYSNDHPLRFVDYNT